MSLCSSQTGCAARSQRRCTKRFQYFRYFCCVRINGIWCIQRQTVFHIHWHRNLFRWILVLPLFDCKIYSNTLPTNKFQANIEMHCCCMYKQRFILNFRRCIRCQWRFEFWKMIFFNKNFSFVFEKVLSACANSSLNTFWNVIWPRVMKLTQYQSKSTIFEENSEEISNLLE